MMLSKKRASVSSLVLAVLVSVGGALAAGVSEAAATSAPGVTHGPGSTSTTGVLPSVYADVDPPNFPASTPLSSVHHWVSDALAVRGARLVVLSNELATSKALTSTVRTELTTLVSVDSAGIAGLSGALQPAATLQALETTASSMIVAYRVFAVVAPVVQDVIEASGQQVSVNSLQALEPAIEAAITTAQPGRKSVPRAQAVYRDLTTQLADVESTDQAQEGLLVALRPSSYPGASSIITVAGTDLTAASARLVTARADVRRIVALLAASGVPTQRRLDTAARG